MNYHTPIEILVRDKLVIENDKLDCLDYLGG